MKKIILVLAVLTYGLIGAEITWIKTYKEGTEIAKKQNKPILLFLYRPGCSACQKMKDFVFTDEMIYTYINKEFVPVALNIGKNDAPKDLQSFASPTFHFLRYDGSKVRETLMGGKTGKFYLDLLKEAVENYKKQ